ncbi:TfuA domain-containing protein [Mesorhizobium sanjuanii]|uniref:TfuA domain-containing protein n=1 Tax=Mesorhizobium sanjuanii TaxID=2037900 RepID=A0A2A6FBT6_9HYPH|nr:TfuA domain-containing protein [Mesorhizobium sanjuanii]
MRPTLVFTGPTLSHADAGRLADVVCLPPAVQGSIVAAVQHFDPAAILIVDGGFQLEPAVRHKEILWAVGQGITVVGAASMGALRAAELHPYMRGVGLIYRWYRRFPFARDDAVAVLHGPEEANFCQLTHALIDLRRTLRNALRLGQVARSEAENFEKAAATLNFRDRSVISMIRHALPTSNDDEIAAFGKKLSSAFVSQKKDDALAAMQLLRAGLPRPGLLRDFRMTVAFKQDLDDAGLDI